MTDIKHESTRTTSHHTPGPWTAIITPAGSAMPHKIYGPRHEDGGFYAALCTVSVEADARLIAAAPNLLACLQYAYGILGRIYDGEDVSADEIGSALQPAAEAIAQTATSSDGRAA